MNGKIYKVTCIVNNKVYIGQTRKDLLTRKREHECDSLRENHPSYFTKFHKAMRKYGFGSFDWNVIEEVSINLLNEREIYFIKLFDSVKLGYNLTEGGKVVHASHLTEGHKRKISQALKGVKKSKSARAKMSKAKIGYIPWNKGVKGKQVPWNKGLKMMPK